MIDKSDYLIEKLDKGLHDRDGFDCGVEVLNLYLQKRANQEQRKRLNVTYIIRKKSDCNQNDKSIICGFYTLSNSAIKYNEENKRIIRNVPNTYDIPSVKIGRLAIDRKHQGMGIGRLLLRDACKRIVELSTLSGVKGVEVIAKDETACCFYEAYGFMRLVQASNLLFLPIETMLASYNN